MNNKIIRTYVHYNSSIYGAKENNRNAPNFQIPRNSFTELSGKYYSSMQYYDCSSENFQKTKKGFLFLDPEKSVIFVTIFEFFLVTGSLK
jgi:hypothetical protein